MHGYYNGWLDAAHVLRVCVLMGWLRSMGIEGQRLQTRRLICLHFDQALELDAEQLRREFALPPKDATP